MYLLDDGNACLERSNLSNGYQIDFENRRYEVLTAVGHIVRLSWRSKNFWGGEFLSHPKASRSGWFGIFFFQFLLDILELFESRRGDVYVTANRNFFTSLTHNQYTTIRKPKYSTYINLNALRTVKTYTACLSRHK